MKYDTFPVGWESFDRKLILEKDQNIFIIVDDHSSSIGPIWDEVFANPDLSSSYMLNIMRGLGLNVNLHNQVGIPCISWKSLPAVFCITPECLTGTYLLNATAEQAVQFIADHLTSQE